jgi:hypothetical protein
MNIQHFPKRTVIIQYFVLCGPTNNRRMFRRLFDYDQPSRVIASESVDKEGSVVFGRIKTIIVQFSNGEDFLEILAE